jgi:UDP-N-acetylglucosamine--N-acetylmuramyl-(pentapeptide) pyrophosphoryl-undecaprenol N-acetylglucosamine transferase
VSVLQGAAVLLAAGGTGGHIMPALAVAEEVAARGAEVSFVTTPALVERVAGTYPSYPLDMRGFERRLTAPQNVRTVRLLAGAAPRAWGILSRVKPRAVVGGGGYISGPVVALAAARGVATIALEADAHLGLTNRLLRPVVGRLCLSYPIAGLQPPKYVVTGRPLTAALVGARREDGLAAFGLSPYLPVLVVVGGSQGAQSLNAACLEAFARPDLDVQIVHVCGPRNLAAASAELERRGAPVERYKLVAYTDHLAEAMAAATLIVSRSGGSVSEIAALGRPAVLVPYPYASADHQRKNAAWMAAAGAALVVDDAELTGARLRALASELLADPTRLATMAAASAQLGRPDARVRVADELEALLERRMT